MPLLYLFQCKYFIFTVVIVIYSTHICFLGDLIFLILINDPPLTSEEFKFIMYTDDTTYYSTFEFSCHQRNVKINEEFEKKDKKNVL